MNTSTNTQTTQLRVSKQQLSNAELHQVPHQPPQTGQVRVRIEQFALTANNITYAAFGDAMQYWQFFPTDEGWGLIPVWGFATVVESSCAEVAVGERLYGYFPMASHAVLQPSRHSPQGFVDGAAHRTPLHPVYNQYLRCAQDPWHSGTSEAVQALLRPLYTTSWLVDDFLGDQQFFGATQVLVSSASSKTAYGTAHALHQRPGLTVVGLTSAANRAFCESLGCYHRVLTYNELPLLDPATPSVYVDLAGNASLRQQVHTHMQALNYSCSIGGAHVQALGSAKDLPGPRAVLFFAPAQIKKRQADWGAAVLQQRLLQAWQQFAHTVTHSTPPWLHVVEHHGAEAGLALYQQMLRGQLPPVEGHVLGF
jgi:hypothetical protein